MLRAAAPKKAAVAGSGLASDCRVPGMLPPCTKSKGFLLLCRLVGAQGCKLRRQEGRLPRPRRSGDPQLPVFIDTLPANMYLSVYAGRQAPKAGGGVAKKGSGRGRGAAAAKPKAQPAKPAGRGRRVAKPQQV